MKTKIVILMLITLAFVMLLPVPSFAYSVNTIPEGEHVTDRLNIPSDSDFSEAEAALVAAENSCGAKIRAVVYSGGYYDYSDYIYESEESFDSLILLVIKWDKGENTFYYYLDTYGDAEYSITDTEVDRILDNPEVYDNIKSGNLNDGIVAYAALAAKAYSGRLRPSFVKVLAISLVIAAITAVAVSLSVFLSYRKKLHSESYPLERYAALNLRVERDSFITKFVTRVRIKTSSGSGGRSGGGRSGGGGSRRGGR